MNKYSVALRKSAPMQDSEGATWACLHQGQGEIARIGQLVCGHKEPCLLYKPPNEWVHLNSFIILAQRML